MSATRRTMCRVCHMSCPIIVEVEQGAAVRIEGDPEGELHHGYTCIKGRELPQQHSHPDRLLRSMKRRPDGSFEPVSAEQAMDEIAARLLDLLDEHGPLAVANYTGTMGIASALTIPFQEAFAAALGGRSCFTANSIDQPGKSIAKGFHGIWTAPAQGLDDADVGLLIGTNPLVSNAGGLSMANPRRWLRDAKARGFKLIVVDPRSTETATQAELFVQPRPGADIDIVAGLIRVILDEGLYDAKFVAAEVDGVDALRAAVAPFTPEEVARRAGITEAEMIACARMFARGPRGTALAGTGPNMSTARGTLFEYLMLCLNTICGRWLRAGETLWNPGTVVRSMPHRAQARPPFRAHGLGHPMRVRDLGTSLAGPPTSALADEILLPGEGQVRALVNCGGNPVVAWPDQLRTVEALGQLELLVSVDPWMTATAKLSDYVIAPKLSLETASITTLFDSLLAYAPGVGVARPWAQYTGAVVDPPPASDLVAEWELFFGLAVRMGLELAVKPLSFGGAPEEVRLDMSVTYTEDDLIEVISRGSRVPLSEVKRHPGGAVFDEPAVIVEPKEEGWTGRLDVGNPTMLADLAEVAAGSQVDRSTWADDRHPFRLVSRRMHTRYNSSGHSMAKLREATPFNPAYLNPDDLEALGLTEGERVVISSGRASIVAIVEPDPRVRSGVVSMTHAWGDTAEHDADLATLGSPTARLSDIEDAFDPYSGQPVMSNIPVRLDPVAASGASAAGSGR